jgi:hypothetical protein
MMTRQFVTVHTHPTLAEAVHEAAEHGLGHAVHILNRKAKPAAPASAQGLGASAH